MTNSVLVLINTELGWDCIVGVFDNTDENFDNLTKLCVKHDTYVLFERDIQSFNIKDYE